MKENKKKDLRPVSEVKGAPDGAAVQKKKKGFVGFLAAVATTVPALVAILVALSLLTAVFAVLTFAPMPWSKDKGTGSGSGAGSTVSNAGFAYRDEALGDYITLLESMVTGLSVPGADAALDPVTEENVKQYIEAQLLSKVALTATQLQNGSYTPKKSIPITYADELLLYVLYVENEQGEHVREQFFNNAYMDSGFFQVGMEAFGPAFDEALIGKKPTELGSFEFISMGEIDADDVIVISYSATEKIPAKEGEEDAEETAVVHKNVVGMRVDLGDLSEEQDVAWREALLASYGTIGQSFTFDIEEDIDEDGTKEKVTYEGVVASKIVDETPYEVTVKLPDDYFGSAPTDEELKALNGATLKFYIVVDYLVEHEANTFDEMTTADMINVLGFTPTNLSKINKETNPDGYEEEYRKAREACLAQFKKDLEEQNKTSTESVTLSLIWNHLLDNLEFTGELPKEALDEVKEALREQVEYYYSYYSSDSAFLEQFPNIDLYAASVYMWNYDAKEYDGYEDYIDNYLAPRSVKQQLLTFGIYKAFINDKTKLDAKYEELIAEIIEVNTEGDQAPTRKEVIEHFEKTYGKYYITDQATVELVNEYLAEKNTIDWNTYKDKDNIEK